MREAKAWRREGEKERERERERIQDVVLACKRKATEAIEVV